MGFLWDTMGPFKRRPYKMVKLTQTIRRHFVGLALKDSSVI